MVVVRPVGQRRKVILLQVQILVQILNVLGFVQQVIILKKIKILKHVVILTACGQGKPVLIMEQKPAPPLKLKSAV